MESFPTSSGQRCLTLLSFVVLAMMILCLSVQASLLLTLIVGQICGQPESQRGKRSI